MKHAWLKEVYSKTWRLVSFSAGILAMVMVDDIYHKAVNLICYGNMDGCYTYTDKNGNNVSIF